MSQHDYVIANGTGAAVRSDLNNALAAIVSNNSGSTEPATTYAYQWWADTTANQLKLRNAANSAWITIQELDGTMLMEDGSAASPGLAFASDLDTGFFRAGTNQLGIATNGVERVEFGTTEVVFNDGGNDIDFRIEGDTNANLFFVDAGNDRIGLGTSSPVSKLHVVETATAEGLRIDGASGGYVLVANGGTARSTAIKQAMIGNSYVGLTPPTNGLIVEGSVGIGTTAPSQLLEIKGANARFAVNSTTVADGGILLQGNGTTYAEIKLDASSGILDIAEKQAAGNITFSTGTAPTERARIDSSGRLLVGTSSARDNFYNTTGEYPAVQIEGTDYNKASLAITLDVNTVTAPRLVFGKTRGGSIGSNTIVQSGDQVGVLSFQGSDGTNLVDAARIQCEVDGTPGADDMPGRLVFSTTADGASSPTERMRIGNIGGIDVSATGNGDNHLRNTAAQTTASGANMFIDATSGVLRRSTSSIKYKTNVETLQNSYADAILNCRPVWYQSTSNYDNHEWGYWGFIAEEVAEIDPRLCLFGTNEDGTLEPEGVQYDRFVPHLLNLIKRQGEAIAELQAKVAALKGA